MLFAWAQDESEAEMVSIPDLLKTIRQGNMDNKNIIQIMQDGCPESAYKDVPIGDKKLGYFAIHCTEDFETIPLEPQTTSFIDWELNDKNNEVNVIPIQKNTIEYETTLGWAKLYQFFESKEASPPLLYENSDNLLFEFVILKEDADKFEDYLYPTWEKLMTETELTPSEIATVREGIKKVIDPEKKKQLYLELQEKVPYHNQRDNQSIASDEDVENNSSWLDDGETIGDIMCNMTCFAACLEYLGKQKPCEGCTEDCKDQALFPDYLECVHKDKIRPLGDAQNYHRKTALSRKLLGNYFNIKQGYSDVISDKTLLKAFLEDKLGKGYAVMASSGGHLVRIQGVDDENVIVDDPYGQLDMKRKLDGENGYRCKTCDPIIDNRNSSNSTIGNNNKWKIDDAIKIFTYYEYYYN